MVGDGLYLKERGRPIPCVQFSLGGTEDRHVHASHLSLAATLGGPARAINSGLAPHNEGDGSVSELRNRDRWTILYAGVDE